VDNALSEGIPNVDVCGILQNLNLKVPEICRHFSPFLIVISSDSISRHADKPTDDHRHPSDLHRHAHSVKHNAGLLHEVELLSTSAADIPLVKVSIETIES
jgi:hypothetical protein